MKILLINCVYGQGSTGKILEDVKHYLQAKGHQALVAYGNGTVVNEDGAYLFCHRWEVRLTSFLVKIGRLHYSGLYLPTRRLIKYLKSEKPDVAHIHCLNGYCVDSYKILKYLAICDIKTIVTHHAEFYYTGSCSHSYDCQKWKDGSCGPCPNRREATAAIWTDNTRLSWMKMKESFSFFKPNQLRFTAVSP